MSKTYEYGSGYTVSIKNKDDLLDNKIAFESNVKNSLVHTDKKWLEFIINQIINNSIKYKKSGKLMPLL